jgi:RNA polymerase sigma-70 factor, ECF subfamily
MDITAIEAAVIYLLPFIQANSQIRDEDLPIIINCRNGDNEAFQALVERYQKKMLNIAYRILDDYEDACDVVQESFISAYRALSKFRGDSTFSAWLAAIVMNHSRNRLKQKKTRACRECVFLDTPKDPENERVLFELPSEKESAQERLEKMEVERKVQDCINTLSDDYKDVVVLRDIQGFSYEEISTVLKLSDGTVKSRLFRARDSLRDCLSDVIGFIEGTL